MTRSMFSWTALTVVMTAGTLSAQSDGIHATVVSIRRDTSPALSSIPAFVPKSKGKGILEHEVKPLPPLPPRAPGKKAGKSVVQTTATSKLAVSTPVSFPGIGDGSSYRVEHIPSDTTGAIGDTQYVQWVNEAFQIFDRKGKSVYGPTLGQRLWTDFGGPCQTTNDGDPIVQYDKTAHRWFLTQFAVDGGPPFAQCIAVSESPDATGKYLRYAISFDKFNDYPKVGVWSDAYYISFNMFDENDKPLGSKLCALNRAKAMAGTANEMQCFDTEEFGVIPADLDGTVPPPAGSPGYAMNFTLDALQLWQLVIDWDHPENSRMKGPKVIPVAQFDSACPTGACIPQKSPAGQTNRLMAMGDRLMYRVAYRNFGDHEALVLNHAVDVNTQGKPASGIRWYELRDPRNTAAVTQQSTYALGTTVARWMGSPAMDKKGNLLIGYSTSTASDFAAVALAGRASGDPQNQLSQEVPVISGAATARGGRWGDYATMSVDPVDDCTMWFTTEVMSAANKLWQTQVVHTKFNNCQ